VPPSAEGMPEILAGPVEEMDAAASAEGEPEAVARRSLLEEYKTYVDSETEVLGEPPQDRADRKWWVNVVRSIYVPGEALRPSA
jgi:hypothetical protein